MGHRTALGRLPRFAVLGASRIVPKALLDPAQGWLSILGVAARDGARARATADTWGLERAYPSYELALADPDVDAVYVATPCSEHARLCRAALEAGKHVLCEKPFAMAANEARLVVEHGERLGLLVMEAHHSRFHPLREAFCESLGEIGRIESIDAVFDAAIQEEGDIRLQPTLGAGVLLDFGCYLVSWVNWVLAQAEGQNLEPADWVGRGARNFSATSRFRVAQAKASTRPTEVDRSFDAELVSEGKVSGVVARVSCSMQPDVEFRARIVVQGAAGLVSFDNPLALGQSKLVTTAGEHVPVGPVSFATQLQMFAQAVETGAPVCNTGEDIVRLALGLDEAYRAAGLLLRSELRGQALAAASLV